MELKNNKLILSGSVGVEASETLLEMLLENPDITKVDLKQVTHIHTAVLQVLLAANKKMKLPEDSSLHQVFSQK